MAHLCVPLIFHCCSFPPCLPLLGLEARIKNLEEMSTERNARITVLEQAINTLEAELDKKDAIITAKDAEIQKLKMKSGDASIKAVGTFYGHFP